MFVVLLCSYLDVSSVAPFADFYTEAAAGVRVNLRAVDDDVDVARVGSGVHLVGHVEVVGALGVGVVERHIVLPVGVVAVSEDYQLPPEGGEVIGTALSREVERHGDGVSGKECGPGVETLGLRGDDGSHCRSRRDFLHVVDRDVDVDGGFHRVERHHLMQWRIVGLGGYDGEQFHAVAPQAVGREAHLVAFRAGGVREIVALLPLVGVEYHIGAGGDIEVVERVAVLAVALGVAVERHAHIWSGFKAHLSALASGKLVAAGDAVVVLPLTYRVEPHHHRGGVGDTGLRVGFVLPHELNGNVAHVGMVEAEGAVFA